MKLVSDRLREMKTCVMLLAALMLPSIQAGKNVFSSFHLHSLFQGHLMPSNTNHKYLKPEDTVQHNIKLINESLWVKWKRKLFFAFVDF